MTEIELETKIDERVNDINTAFLSMAHIVVKNPIIHDCVTTKREYIKRLNSYFKIWGWNRRKYEGSELRAYEKIIFESEDIKEEHEIDFYQYYIIFDMIHIMGYVTSGINPKKLKVIIKKYYNDFPNMRENKRTVELIFKSVQQESKKWKRFEKNPLFVNEKEYIQLIRKNIEFKNQKPLSIMVTATMSAGKSTFINALVGKYICLSQNIACTSKIHCILNKAFEDGYSYEYDHDLVMTAGREELLNDNNENLSDKIFVGTHFSGYLGRHRVIVNDSPGVNFSGNTEHKLITERLIKERNYNLLIYVMNATQLATNDEDEHLEFVKRSIGRKPIIFIINKIDNLNVEEEDVFSILKRQTEYLKRKGFKKPIVCPLSSRAGYLAKRFKEDKLSRIEKRELYNFVDKFEKMKLQNYYDRTFDSFKIKDCECEEEQLLKTSGLAFVEKIIMLMMIGGKENGSDLC